MTQLSTHQRRAVENVVDVLASNVSEIDLAIDITPEACERELDRSLLILRGAWGWKSAARVIDAFDETDRMLFVESVYVRALQLRQARRDAFADSGWLVNPALFNITPASD